MFDPKSLQRIGTGLDVFGGLYGAFSELSMGRQEREAAEFQAAQLRQNAGQAMASAQRDAFTTQQQADLVASRALAVAAASGGGASDPTVVKIMAGIAQEGAYRTAVALYQGEERAREMLNRAEGVEYSGKVAQRAATKNAIGKVIGTGASAIKGVARGQSLYEKYGGGGPTEWKAD